MSSTTVSSQQGRINDTTVNNNKIITAACGPFADTNPTQIFRDYDRMAGGGQQVADSREQHRKMLTGLTKFGELEMDKADKLMHRIKSVPVDPVGFDFSRSSSYSTSREQRAEEVLDSTFAAVYLGSIASERQRAFYEGYLSPFEVGITLAAHINQNRMREMMSIGYQILEFGSYNWTTVIEALTLYQKLNGETLVPKDFVLTIETLPAVLSRPHLIHMPLGELVESIRVGDVDALEDLVRKSELDKLDFQWGDTSTYLRFRFSPMLQGLKIYSALHDIALTPPNYIVPSDDPTWPVWMHGMPLGLWCDIARVQQNTIKRHYPARYEMLNAIDFVWWVEPGQYFPAKYYTPIELTEQ